MENEIKIINLNQHELQEITGGRSFAYDVGWGIRFVASYVGGPGTIASFWANETAVEAIEAMK